MGIMFRDKTTFVIGAGASAEFGLPVGSQLAQQIRETCKLEYERNYGSRIANEDFAHAVTQGWPEFRGELIYKALQRIHTAIDTSVSIDAFIHRNRNDKVLVEMGKALIAWNIASAEANSRMRTEGYIPGMIETFNRSEITDTWIGKFTRILFDGVTDARELSKQVRIICFNYDRCIEYYLIESIMVAFDTSRKDAAEIVSEIEIIHPYGYLGKVPEDLRAAQDDECAFGRPVSYDFPLRKVSSRIRTYTEQTQDIALVKRIHSAINSARNLVFLGFGFNNQNLDLMRVMGGLATASDEPKNIYASGKGIAGEVEETLKRRITNIYSHYDFQTRKSYYDKINVCFDKTCGQLFDTHQMNLQKFILSSFDIMLDGVEEKLMFGVLQASKSIEN
ncbi:hypothetical protein [Brucella rhizosphaerae]|uniref:hypothetical protein n=1 Tax=Brucella rhizosphaerae TaxID=571254 RepID=UPI00360DA712